MSEQADALNRKLREEGILAPPATPAVTETGAGPAPATEKPWVELPRPGRYLHEFAWEIGAVAKTNGVFVRDKVPVTIQRTWMPRENAYKYGMEPMTAARFRTYAEGLANPYKRKMRTIENEDGTKETKIEKEKNTMKPDIAAGTLASDEFLKQQRELTKTNTVRQPVERRDGRIELLPVGYDAETGIHTEASEVVIDESWDLARARTFLIDLHKEFPFADKSPVTGLSRGLAVHLAGMLSLFAEALLEPTEARMNFVYDANSPGSGKTLLVKLNTIPTTGICEGSTIPDQDAEFRKLLDTAALSGSPYLFFDEVQGNIRNATLNAFMTMDYWSGRKFNTQAKFSCPKVTICYLAGNTLSVTPDIARRSLICQLYVEEANVQDRAIARVLSSRELARPAFRGDVLSALWALIRAWDVAGRPPCTRTVRGFERWAAIFGGIIEHAGLGNPLEPPPADESLNPEGDDMLLLVKTLATPLGPPAGTDGTILWFKEYKFDEVIEACVEKNCFAWKIEGKRRKEKVGDVLTEGEFELTPKSNSAMGSMLSKKFGGQLFTWTEADGKVRRVRFGNRGRNRSKVYQVQLLEEGQG